MAGRKKIVEGRDELAPEEKRVLMSLYNATNRQYGWERRVPQDESAKFILDDMRKKGYVSPEKAQAVYDQYRKIFEKLEDRGLITLKRKLTERISTSYFVPALASKPVTQDQIKRRIEKGTYRITEEGIKLIEQKANLKIKGNLASRVSTIIFILAGITFMTLPEFTSTGNITGSSSGLDLSFILSFTLIIIGGILFFQSFKKR